MSEKITRPYALVTGASRGLGKAFVVELVKREWNVILVSLPGENLKDFSDEINSQGHIAIPYETDLTIKKNLIALTAWVNDNYQVEILINNAGIGGNSHFLNADIERLDEMIQLNVRATTIITRQILPNLLRQKRAYVLNISSLAALSPIAFKTVYPATKAFIHSFTRGMQHEFSDTHVSFSVVHPGPMKMNGEWSGNRAGVGEKFLNLSPQKVAAISLEKMFNGEAFIKLDWVHRMSLLLLNLPEGIKMKILGRFFKNEIESTEK